MKHLFCFILITSLAFSVKSQERQMTNIMDSVSYSLGIVMGTSIGNAGIKTLNDQLFIRGINDAIAGSSMALTPEQANLCLNQYITVLNVERAQANLKEGEQFLAENAKKEGVVSRQSGLQYKVIKDGQGRIPVDTSYVKVHYTGTLIDGKVFDSSVERGEPVEFNVDGVIPGWTEALKLMKEGANWILYIPSHLAYGERGNQAIAPNSVLIFDVQLISVE